MTLFPSGIYAYVNGELRIIVDGDTVAPGGSVTSIGFSTGPVISGENVAFGGGDPNTGAAIFAYIDGALQRIADTDTPVPGHADTTFNTFDLSNDVRPSISGENVVFYGDGRLPGKQKQFITGIYARIIDPPIPAASPWALIVLILLVALGGIIILRRRGDALGGGETHNAP